MAFGLVPVLGQMVLVAPPPVNCRIGYLSSSTGWK